MSKLPYLLTVGLLALPSLARSQVVINPGGGGGVSSGSVVSGCTAFSLVYIDTSGNLACAQAPINGATSTAGTAITKINATITGASATSNFLNITGTFPATLSAETRGISISITGDDDAQTQTGVFNEFTPVAGNNTTQTAIKSILRTGTSLNSATYGGHFLNETVNLASAWSVGVRGEFLVGSATNFGDGVVGIANSGSATIARGNGGSFYGNGAAGSTSLRGVWGVASALATNAAGGEFTLLASGATPDLIGLPTAVSGKAALIANNGPVAANIFEARDNGTATSTTAASANVAILDGAQMRLGNQVLTSATMTPTIVGEARTVTHSYAWTNAMVAALGAVTAGDITVATLPAKTQVNNAYVVIDTAGAGTTTLTVSCGDAIGGTPFINYIVASDARAAANTVYGDAVAERGTSIDTEFYYLPSYTATTLVTCHFISTGANLSAVTTSTGRLILTTTLLP